MKFDLIHQTVSPHANKLVVLTTQWLPWLQTNWRDSGNERFALVLDITSACDSLTWLHKSMKVPYCNYEVHFNDSFTDVLSVVSV